MNLLKTIFYCALASFSITVGCMSPERAVREADKVGSEIVSEYFEKVANRTNEFSIARPSDRLRNRLLAEQGLDPDAAELLKAALNANQRQPLPDPLILSLADALRVGAANDNKYQEEKEELFKVALALDAKRQDFEATFAGILTGGVAGDKTDGSKATGEATGGAGGSISKKFRNGASLAASVGLDIVKLLTGGGSTLGLVGDGSMTIPLLRGSGRLVASEPLTQAERNMLYAIYDFEAFRQSFAVEIASAYYGMLKADQKLIALRENAERLTKNYERAKLLYEAGRLSQVELDQTRQDLLSTDDNLVNAEKSRQSELDSFKIRLGLPVDARINLDMSELDRLAAEMGLDIDGTNTIQAAVIQPTLPWSEDDAVAIALTNCYNLSIARYRIEDCERALLIAEDGLRADLGIKLSGSLGRSKKDGESAADKSSYSAVVESDMPWERTSERNAYRIALIALDASRRSLESLEDKTRQLVRDDIRSINSAWSSFLIQREALSVAQRRVRSTTLFQQAGRSSTRDLLESESSLLSARNSVVSAIVEYRMAGLRLRRDMSMLRISEEGLLLDDEK